MKTHWLFGRGPDKLLDFKREIDEETDCGKCIHREVCDRNMEKRCENYVFGTSAEKSCHSCLHRFTRYDKDAVPCFSCPWFEEPKEKASSVTRQQAQVSNQPQPKVELIGCRFRPLRYHPKTHERVAVVLRVYSSQRTGCGVALTFRYEDSPTSARRSVSQHWFLENYAPVEMPAEAP